MPRKVYYWNRETQRMEEERPEPKLDLHFIQDDTMPATRHPVTGEIFESKSAFRRVTRANHLEEVGNDWAGQRPRVPEPRFNSAIPILRERLDHLK